MLRRVLATLLVLAPLLVAAPAARADTPVCLKTDPLTGVCIIFAGDGGTGGGGGGTGGGNGGGAGGGDGGTTNPVITVDGQNCIYVGLASPQPPQSDPVWKGNTDGAIHRCTKLPGGGGGQGGLGGGTPISLFFWSATTPAPPPPDPAVLARQAIATMGLSAIDIGIVPEAAPGRVGVVGMPTWMWAANPGENTMGPITRTASAGGYTVTATATVSKVVWNMGDGKTVTCTGPGKAYSDNYGKSSSPTCGHTYTRQGEYAVTATSYWTVTWAGIGETGTIPLDFQNTATITMGEAQVITK